MRALQSRRRRDESGGVAVLFAIVALLLLSLAALAVDLGNAWARGRIVQKQADVAVLSVGHLLPKTSANLGSITQASADYLNRNLAPGQEAVVPGALTNADLADGEVVFQDAQGQPCTEDCVRMTLHPPQAQVDFGFASAMGVSGTTVQRAATVEVSSELPPMDKVLPLWLPFGCGYGPVAGDTSGGNSPSSPTPSPSPSPSPTGVVISPLGAHSISSTTSPIVVAAQSRVVLRGLVITGLPSNTDKASLRFVRPDGSGFIESTAYDPKKQGSFQVPEFEIGPSGDPAATSITDVPGDWRVYAMAQPKGNKEASYSTNAIILRVGGVASPTPSPTPTTEPTTPPSESIPVGCVGQDRGNFGQLNSPRKGVTGRSDRMAKNMALGLDHMLVPFRWGNQAPTDSCAHSNGNNPIPGAQLDNVSRPGNNCIIADSGNDGPAMFKGLIAGVDGSPGRLSAAAGTTTCSGRSNTVIGGTSVNNDVLSCFLNDGYSLADISAPSGVTPEMLDGSVKDSPRFVWLPLVQATDRSEKGYQPMIDFVPAFITDEAYGSAATSANGLSIKGNSISDIQLFVFNKDALAVDERSPVTEYNPEYGRALVRLVG